MAYDPGQAIGIIGALQEAGLLRTARSASEPAAEVIGALSEAGLLQTETSSTPAPPPPPPPGAAVGDAAYLGRVGAITKLVQSGSVQVVLSNYATQGKGNYYVDFPPNDVSWLPEIDKIIAIPKGLNVVAVVEITNVRSAGEYGAELNALWLSTAIG